MHAVRIVWVPDILLGYGSLEVLWISMDRVYASQPCDLSFILHCILDIPQRHVTLIPCFTERFTYLFLFLVPCMPCESLCPVLQCSAKMSKLLSSFLLHFLQEQEPPSNARRWYLSLHCSKWTPTFQLLRKLWFRAWQAVQCLERFVAKCWIWKSFTWICFGYRIECAQA